MSENRDSLESQSQENASQVQVEDNFSEPNTMSSSSIFAEPSSYYSQTVAYGTNINVPQAANEIRQFVQKFTVDQQGPDAIGLYLEKIKEMKEIDNYNLNVDMQHVKAYQEMLYKQIVSFPLEMIQIFDSVVKEMFQSFNPDDPHVSSVQVRPYNLSELKSIRQLHPCDIDRLVSVQGMITRTSPVLPDLSEVAFKCRNCGHVEIVQVANGKVAEQTTCPQCNSANTLEIEHNLSLFSDRQHIKLQESPETIPQGETPQTVGAIVFEELVDYAKPGDRVVLTGVWRAMPARVNPRVRTLHSVYRTYIDVVHIRKNLERAIGNEDKSQDFDESTRTQRQIREREERARKLAEDPELYDKLIGSFAPSIWQMDEQKKGLLSLLFGGSTSAAGTRGDINILLVGDPATAKSQLIQYTHKIAPRGLYTSGKGSSAVGLTASVVRDPESGEFVLESGALVLSDKGVCCIDEFDKMNDSARSVLHEVMEQQTISIAKAGIVTTLNARAAIVACANPRDSSYNKNLSVVDNIQLPPTLLSRFDLVYLVLDSPDENRDRQLAKHIIGLFTTRDEVATPIPPGELSDYIAYAKEHCNPQLTDEAEKLLIDGYLEMRSLGGRNVISATPRQLESCIRIAEAWAKMRLSPTVEKQDVENALKLMQEALHQSATDPTTGIIDMDLLTTGTSTEKRNRISSLCKEIIRILDATKEETVTVSFIQQKLRTAPQFAEVQAKDIDDALYSLEADEVIYLNVENNRPTKASLLRQR